MVLLLVGAATVMSLFAGLVMTYISMATFIGPWIETTIVLLGMIGMALVRRWTTRSERMQSVGLMSAAAGIAGIAATGAGFTLPTLFFLDQGRFAALLARPGLFCTMLALSTIVAGAWGLLAAQYGAPRLLDQDKLAFPVGDLVYKMIVAVDELARAVMLLVGAGVTAVYTALIGMSSYASRPCELLAASVWGICAVPRMAVMLDQVPMFIAIGFVTGHMIAVPLMLGILSKLGVIDPLYVLYLKVQPLMPTIMTPDLSASDFTLAFTSGLVLYGAVKSFLRLPSMFAKLYNTSSRVTLVKARSEDLVRIGLLCLVTSAWFWSMSFSFVSQLFVGAATAVCIYQLTLIAGQFGIAPLGRFATFVMIPFLILFGFDPVQVTMVSFFVEVSGGVACDALFGKKMALRADIERPVVARYQWLGLVVGACAIAVSMYLFISFQGLGNSPGQLAATRAASRALLATVSRFDLIGLACGMVYAACLSYLGIQTALLLGGILMPLSYTVMLIAGGMLTYLVQDKEEYYPFWSGVFATNSLWMLLRALW